MTCHSWQNCDRRFFILSDLNLHLFSHTGDKRFFCSYCGAGFLKMHVMKEHEAKHENNEKVRYNNRKPNSRPGEKKDPKVGFFAYNSINLKAELDARLFSAFLLSLVVHS